MTPAADKTLTHTIMNFTPTSAMLIAPRPNPAQVPRWQIPSPVPNINPPQRLARKSPANISSNDTDKSADSVPPAAANVDKLKRNAGKRLRSHKSLTRSFTEEEDLVLIAYWEKHYDQYARSSKLSFARCAATHLNSIFSATTPHSPPTTEKQVHNKLTYLSKRFRKVCTKYALRSGSSISDLKNGSMALVAAKEFPYFLRLYNFLADELNIPVKSPLRDSPKHESCVTIPPHAVITSNRNGLDAKTRSDGEQRVYVETNETPPDAPRKRLRKAREYLEDGSKMNGKGSSISVDNEHAVDDSSGHCEALHNATHTAIQSKKSLDVQVMQLQISIKEKELELKNLDVLAKKAELDHRSRDIQIRERELQLRKGELDLKRTEAQHRSYVARAEQQRLLVTTYLSMGMAHEAKIAAMEAARLLSLNGSE